MDLIFRISFGLISKISLEVATVKTVGLRTGPAFTELYIIRTALLAAIARHEGLVCFHKALSPHLATPKQSVTMS